MKYWFCWLSLPWPKLCDCIRMIAVVGDVAMQWPGWEFCMHSLMPWVCSYVPLVCPFIKYCTILTDWWLSSLCLFPHIPFCRVECHRKSVHVLFGGAAWSFGMYYLDSSCFKWLTKVFDGMVCLLIVPTSFWAIFIFAWSQIQHVQCTGWNTLTHAHATDVLWHVSNSNTLSWWQFFDILWSRLCFQFGQSLLRIPSSSKTRFPVSPRFLSFFCRGFAFGFKSSVQQNSI